MSNIRVNSSPDLRPIEMNQPFDDSALEGVAANVKLLLKLIQDHKDACKNKENDGRRMLRVAGMMTVLDNVRTRIQKCQSFGNKRSEAELRRCNTDLLRPPRDNKPCEPATDEKDKLRKDLNASLAARKSLEVMCTSLGKEKEIMAAELARKVHEMNETEELVNDLREQNQILLEKVKEYALEPKDRGSGAEMQGNAALQDRNKTLSDQLKRSLEGYRYVKRRYKEAKEENAALHTTFEELGKDVQAGLEYIRGIKQQIATGSKQVVDAEEVSELENMFECLELKVLKHEQKAG